MKFLVPAARSPEQAEEVYEGIKKFAKQTLGWEIESARICSITYKDKMKTVTATVGGHEPREGEVVVAILESNTYLVCTPNRGVLRGMPIMVGKQEVSHVELFEP